MLSFSFALFVLLERLAGQSGLCPALLYSSGLVEHPYLKASVES